MVAYHEYVNRRHQEQLTPERAYDLIYAVTGDADAADAAYSNIKFSTTPLQ